MTVGLFIPCYMDQLYPNAAIATLELLEGLSLDVVYPLHQTCCGQPLANSGFSHLTQGCNALFIENFSRFDYVVCPSGSCALHIKEHLSSLNQQEDATALASRVYELVEFLTDVIKIQALDASFPHKVSLHHSCHSLRGLYLAQMSELSSPTFSKPNDLLNMVDGLELVKLERSDECCGFGGTFCVFEEAVSAKMGKDRVDDHVVSGSEYITSSDMSCLMHMEGILKRNHSATKVIHIAEILNSKSAPNIEPKG
ncbi:L-lactate dehydrogenase complex protein LldE [Parapedobacter koreensis]|uniref:L-lactate dehydrogenase complex protein LldE n=2 Tax=Parapedobacter koreensis TaxID=332977 RepID=A0A1H7GCR8_9SPHI|nr:L-lactate dehydrogenase complex protein LldE [Parapedobacter koreensis]